MDAGLFLSGVLLLAMASLLDPCVPEVESTTESAIGFESPCASASTVRMVLWRGWRDDSLGTSGVFQMHVNFCFDMVIAVRDHDESVRRYETLLGLEPIELAPETLPESGQRCTIFPLWNLGDRGMVLSIVSSTDPESPLARRVDERGEGLAYFGLDVDDVDQMFEQGRAAGMEFTTEAPVEYDYGQMLTVREETAHNIPFFFSTHRPGWWEKVLRAGKTEPV